MKIFKFYILMVMIIGISFVIISCAQKPLIIEYSGIFRLPVFATSVSTAPFIADIEGEIQSKLKGFNILSETGKAIRLFYSTSVVDLGYDDLELDTNLSTELMDATSIAFSFGFTAPGIPEFENVNIALPGTDFGSYSKSIAIDSIEASDFSLANFDLNLQAGIPLLQQHSLPASLGGNFSGGFEAELLSGTLEASVTLSEESTLTIAFFNSYDNLVAKIIRQFPAGISTTEATPLDGSVLTKNGTVSVLSSLPVNNAKINLNIKGLELEKATEVWFDSHTGEGSIIIDTGLEAFEFGSLALGGDIGLGVKLDAFSNAVFDATVTLYEKGSRALPKTVNLSGTNDYAQMLFDGDTIKATDLVLEYEYVVNSGGSGHYADFDLSGHDDIVFCATPNIFPATVTGFVPGIAINADLPASLVAAVLGAGNIAVKLSGGAVLDDIEGKLEMAGSNSVNLDKSLSLAGETIYGGNATFTVDKVSISGLTRGLDLITVSSSLTDIVISGATLTMGNTDDISYKDDISVEIPERIKGLLKRIILNDSPSVNIEWKNDTPVDVNLNLSSEEMSMNETVNMAGNANSSLRGNDSAILRGSGNREIFIPTVIDVEGKDSVNISVDASPSGLSADTLYVNGEIILGKEYTFESTVSISNVKFDKIVIATDTVIGVLELPVSDLPAWFVNNSPNIEMKPGSIYACLNAQANFAENPDLNATILIEDGKGPAANLEYEIPVALNENIYFSDAIEEFLAKPEDFRNVSLAVNVKEATVSLNETLNASVTVDISVEFNSATDITVATGTQNVSLKEAKDVITYVGGATLTVSLDNGAGVGAKIKLTEETAEGTPVHIVDDTGIAIINPGISEFEVPLDRKMIDRIVNDGVNFFYELILAKTPDNTYYSVMGNSNLKVDAEVEVNLRYAGKINLTEKK